MRTHQRRKVCRIARADQAYRSWRIVIESWVEHDDPVIILYPAYQMQTTCTTVHQGYIRGEFFFFECLYYMDADSFVLQQQVADTQNQYILIHFYGQIW